MKFSFYLLLSSMVLLTTCKKYPEEGSHRDAHAKIIGIWKLEQIFINNADSTNSTNYLPYIAKYKFGNEIRSVNFQCSDSSNGVLGYWDLGDRRKKIHFGMDKCSDDDNCILAFFEGDWDILVLTDNKMKLRFTSSYSSLEYTLVFEK